MTFQEHHWEAIMTGIRQPTFVLVLGFAEPIKAYILYMGFTVNVYGKCESLVTSVASYTLQK